MKPTMKDIAKAANVSLATVSNALNNRKGVSDSIRQLVFQKARALGYTRDMAGSKTAVRLVIYKRHGMVVSDTPFFVSLTEELDKQCREQGYELLVSHFNSAEADRSAMSHLLNTDYAAGMIVLATEMLPDDLEILANIRTPVVLLDSLFRECQFDTIQINNIDAAYSATRYLLEQGHTAIGYLHSSVYINNFRDREVGYREAMLSYKIEPEKRYRVLLEPTMDGACRDMRIVLEHLQGNLPTAFFADNDNIALGVMKALQERNIEIPGEVSLVGINDMPFCEMTRPRLTTIRVYQQEISSIAVRRLIEKLHGDPAVLLIEVGTELIIRDSVQRCLV
ncbi:MAG TPA: LacI family DNA-binding transcriptional regulator [Clostridia bacterium]